MGAGSKEAGSLKPIITAIVANSIIAISKGIGYIFSGSSALLSETIHSIADVMNQSLLLIGIKRGEKEENELFHYGYSQERFFWNLVSAMGIFVLGCGVTVYHGVHDLLTPGTSKTGGTEEIIIQIVLLVSLLVEGYSFYVAIKEIQDNANVRGKKFFTYLNESMDPSVSAIFWEDLAAIIGILLAFTGILLTSLTGIKAFDSVASILIGLLMGWIAYHLAIENKKFLIDRSIPEFEMNQVLGILKENELIESYSEVKSIVFGPNRLKVSAKVQLKVEKISLGLVEKIIEELKSNNIQKIDLNELEKILSTFAIELYKAKTQQLELVRAEFETSIPSLKHVELRI
ncbi:MAG: cation diffusion facilitator family transporter [Leptospiraceae bacterium]|nr:cation diffusion facilitator family transporter [Leptospiraceae bacterium]